MEFYHKVSFYFYPRKDNGKNIQIKAKIICFKIYLIRLSSTFILVNLQKIKHNLLPVRSGIQLPWIRYVLCNE